MLDFFIPHQLVACQRHNNVLLSFSYATPVEWNKLVVEIRSVTSLETLKKGQYCIYISLYIIF